MTTKEERPRDDLSDFDSEFHTLVSKLGVDFPVKSDKVLLKKESLKYLTEKCTQEGETLLMKAIKCDHMDAVDYFLRLSGIEVNADNKNKKKAIDIAWEKKNYKCMIMLLHKDSLFPSTFNFNEVDERDPMGRELKELLERRVNLHDSIRQGKLDSVKNIAGKENSSIFYSPENETAIYTAIQHKRHEIYAYLLSIGVKLKLEDKCFLDECDEIEMEKFSNALEDYFISDKNSHLMKLIAATKLLGNLGDAERETVKKIFEWLNQIQFIKHLMKVLAYQEVEIIFDFDSELVDRLYPPFSTFEVYGAYLPQICRIYIAAKNCTSTEGEFYNIAGTVAHEMCHRAMYSLYHNNGNPYHKESKEREENLWNIHKKISKNFNIIKAKEGDKKEKWEKVMEMYFFSPSHDELIVRVPHILGVYGEKEGERVLTDKIPELYTFYSDYVNTDLEKYAATPYFSKLLCSIETLSNVYGIVNEEERSASPFEKMIEYKDYLFKLGNISILLTSNTKLCTLHVYHKLKQKFPFHIQKQCLFIDLRDFLEYEENFYKALQCKLFYCLVLSVKEVDIDLNKLQRITGIIAKDKKVILIADSKCKQLQQVIKQPKVLHYTWESLKFGFKEEILGKIILYQGREIHLRKLMRGELESEVINPEVLSCLLLENNISIGERIQIDSPWCSKGLYIPRTFIRYSYSSLIQNLEKVSCYLFITGIKNRETEVSGIKKQFIQEIENEREMQLNKYIAIPKTGKADIHFFQKYFVNIAETQETSTRHSAHWIHHENGNFYLRYSKGSTDSIIDYREEEILKEDELVKAMQKQRVVIVADDPGAGKSTFISSLVDTMKKKYPDVYLEIVNLNEYAVDVTNYFSLHHIKNYSTSTEILKYFYKILRLKSCLELSLIQCFQNRDNRVIAIFDSFDEIVPLFKNNALKLLRTLLSETKIQIWIFTRNHEKLDLELEMNTSSFSLCPFSSHDQVKFLNNFWRSKFESSEFCNEEERNLFKGKIEMMISVLRKTLESNKNSKLANSVKVLEGIVNDINSMQTSREEFWSKYQNLLAKVDFEDYSRFVLDKVNSTKIEEDKPLTALPLHLYMMAEIIYNENFQVCHHTNIFYLYFDFMESKINTYLREKCHMKSETRDMKIAFNIVKEAILSALTRVLMSLIDPNQHNNLTDKYDNGINIVQRLGLVKKEKGHLHFIHMTICEFVFFELIKDKIKSDKLEAELFSDILFKDNYQEIMRYLDSFFRTEDAATVNFSNSFIKKFNVIEKFIYYLNHCENYILNSSSIGCYIWKKILDNYQNGFEKDEVSILVLKVAEYLKNSYKYNFHRFKLLTMCLNKGMLVELCDQHANLTVMFICNIIAKAAPNEILEVLKLLKMILCFKKQESSIGEGKVAPKLKLFYSKVNCSPGGNIFHWACSNKDENVFSKFLRFVAEFMERKTILDLLFQFDIYGHDIIYHSSLKGNRNILTILEELESFLDERDFSNLIRLINSSKWHFLNAVALCNYSSIYFESLMEYLSEILKDDLLRKLFLQLDCSKQTILHFAARNKNKKLFKIIIKRISVYLQNEEFEKFICLRSYYGGNIFHCRIESMYELKDLKVVEKLVQKEVFQNLLMGVDSLGRTCAHTTCKSKAPTEIILSNLNFIIEKLQVKSLEKFILAEDNEKNTFLHVLAENPLENDWTTFFINLESKLPQSLLKKLIFKKNKKGEIPEIIKIGGNISCRIQKLPYLPIVIKEM